MEKTKLYIYGASGHGKVVADIARSLGYREIVFLDDNSEMKFSPDLPKHPVIIAIGDNQTRANLQTKVLDAGFEVATLVHKTAIISPSASIGKGVVVMPSVVVNADAIIGDGVILNSSCVIEHDCVVGEFSHICPHVAVAGNTKIGCGVWLGIGSSVIQGMSVGEYSFIGAGSVIVNNIAPFSLAYGIPAKVIKKLNEF